MPKNSNTAQKTLYIIDFSALAYRSYYAFIKNPLTTKQGENTSAIFGFVSTIFRIIKERNPTYIIAAQDLNLPTFRHKMYKEYKSQRKPMPDELRQQFPIIQNFLKILKIPCFFQEGYEADDVMASIATQSDKKNIKTFLITKDKDLMQIVNSNIKLFEFGSHKQREQEIGSAEVLEKFGVEPSQMNSLLSLMGDTSDNIPGVPKVGLKTATKLLKTYSSIENLYQNINIISPTSLQSRLSEYKDLALLSQKLVTLETNLSFDLNFEKMKTPEKFSAELSLFLKRWECHSVLSFIDQTNDLSFTKELEQKKTNKKNYILVENENSLDKYFTKLASATTITIKIETTGLDPFVDTLIGVSFHIPNQESFYIPISHNQITNTHHKNFEKSMQDILEGNPKTFIFHDAKWTLLFLSSLNLCFNFKNKHKLVDTLICAYLLNPGQRDLNLSTLAKSYLNIKLTSIEDLTKEKTWNPENISNVPIQKFSQYACENVDTTFKVWNALKYKLEKENLIHLLWEQEIPLLLILMKMEKNGICLDAPSMKIFSDSLESDLQNLEKNIHQESNEKFNIRSTQQLGKILYEKIGLTAKKKTKTGFSTDMETLKKLESSHPIISLILKYRELFKLKSTYVDALPKLINPNTQRIHTSFSQTITATGRLSSIKPNLQNIPIKTEQGKKVRSYFTSPSGYSFLSVDYSQIELRILAHLSQDSILLKAYQNEEDIHLKTAAILFKIPTPTEKMRQIAKSVNFGIIYGMGPKKLASETNVSIKEAKTFIETYFNEYRSIQNYIHTSISQARRLGYSITLFGRKRLLPDLASNNAKYRENAERMSINSPIQGTAADLMKLSAIAIQNWIDVEKMDCKMLLQVHDEFIFEIKDEHIKQASLEIKKCMEEIYPLSVPLKVNIGSGKNWLEAHA